MRLKTKVILAATGLTFAIVIVMSILFLTELLKQRMSETAADTDVMARQVLMMTQQAVEVGLRAQPPEDSSPAALGEAVEDALQSHEPLLDTMDSLVRYSSWVQDVSVTDAHGRTLVSTDPQKTGTVMVARMDFAQLQGAGVVKQGQVVMAKQATVLDVTAPLNRNGQPFLVVHVGVRSSFLKYAYAPRLADGLMLALLCALISTMAAGLLTGVSLRPIEEISRRLDALTATARREQGPQELSDGREGEGDDAVVRVTNTIDRLDRQMKTNEAVYTNLQTNLNQMLDTLRDGVVLFTAERRAVMVSDAVANFMRGDRRPLVGQGVTEIFEKQTALGRAVLEAFAGGENVTAERVRMEDGREVEFSLDWLDAGPGGAEGLRGGMGTLLTLRDRGSARKLEQELEVSRRLAAVGRLTAGVGHEVKNPINAMVVHLELLRQKLDAAGEGRGSLAGAQRHVEILAGEMDRLDRVVQTLADFTRPMELRMEELNLSDVVEAVVELTSGEMQAHQVEFFCRLEEGVVVRGDGELLRQALLNVVLNGMQAMPEGGVLRIAVRKENDSGIVEVRDQGEGIAPELMPRIFDLYFTTKAKGSGIGLAMTYRIVQMHGGGMEAASPAGSGAVLTMRLPAVEMVEAEAGMQQRLVVGSRA